MCCAILLDCTHCHRVRFGNMSEFSRLQQRIDNLRATGNPVPALLSIRLAELRRDRREAAPVVIKKRKKHRHKREKGGKKRNFYRTAEWLAVRYDVLADRGARCECCGVTPREGARMNVDHIIPVSRAWDRRLDPTNLQVLCAACNQGKGARRMDDWRQERADQADRAFLRYWSENGL